MFGTVNSTVDRRVLSAITLLLFSIATLTSCNEKQAKSECYYDRIETLAEVISIERSPDSDDRMLVVLDFKASTLALEDQELGSIKDVRIDQDYVDRNRIKVGNKYEVVVSEITKGDCIPQFVSFNHSFE